jgi:peptidoglycan-associated lipoprotein
LRCNKLKWLSFALLQGEITGSGVSPPDAARMLVFYRKSSRLEIATVSLIVIGALLVLPNTVRAQSENQPASEMLQDGLDALADRQRDLAMQFFEQLRVTYPGTAEADRAERELQSLGAASTQENSTNTNSNEDNEPNPIRRRETDPELRLRFTTEAGDRVFFAENSAVIGGRARALLESQARWLAKRPDLRITIIGRADDGGHPDEARLLSMKRAETVRDKLVASGIAASRIAIDGRGGSDPIATCVTPLCQAQNRHAETFIGTVNSPDATRKTAGGSGGSATVAR